MNKSIRVSFGLFVVAVVVLGACFANQVQAGGGRTEYVPFLVRQEKAPPSLFDLLLLNPPPPVTVD